MSRPTVEEIARAIHADDERQTLALYDEAPRDWDDLDDDERDSYRDNARAVLALLDGCDQ